VGVSESRDEHQTYKFIAIKTSSVPFFIKPITNGIVNRITSFFLRPNFETHYKFLESQLDTSPNSGEFLCGENLTAADILMSFPLEAGESRSGMTKEQFPRVWEYVARLHEREAYKRAVQKIVEVEGSFKTNL
jgi:glutathione S-transferase